MDTGKQNEEKLREACCYGDIEALTALLSYGTNINCKHDINGWTGLHWACKRGNIDAIKWLLANGADVNILNYQNQVPAQLTHSEEIHTLLDFQNQKIDTTRIQPEIVSLLETLPIIPHYLTNPPLDHRVVLSQGPEHNHPQVESSKPLNNGVHVPNGLPEQSHSQVQVQKQNSTSKYVGTIPSKVGNQASEVILKVRIADLDDPDFIEVDFQSVELNYSHLITLCCKELGVNPQRIERIRKLPNTRLRNNKDVQRLKDYDEIELVMKGYNKMSDGSSLNISKNSYQSISSFKNQTILY